MILVTYVEDFIPPECKAELELDDVFRGKASVARAIDAREFWR